MSLLISSNPEYPKIKLLSLPIPPKKAPSNTERLLSLMKKLFTMLPFVILSKPVLPCYSSPDRFPALKLGVLHLKRPMYKFKADMSLVLILF